MSITIQGNKTVTIHGVEHTRARLIAQNASASIIAVKFDDRLCRCPGARRDNHHIGQSLRPALMGNREEQMTIVESIMTKKKSMELLKHFSGRVDELDMIRAIDYAEAAITHLETEHAPSLRYALNAVRDDVVNIILEGRNKAQPW